MKRLLVILSIVPMIGLFGCGDDDPAHLSAYGLSKFELQTHESKEVVLRYLNHDGYPIVGGAVRFRLEPESGHGATMGNPVSRADPQGLARSTVQVTSEAQFRIVAEADNALPVRMDVSVSNSNGGKLEVLIYTRAAASATQAEVTLVGNISCATFDPMTPPSPASEVIDAVRPTAISSTGTPVTFSGLKPDRQYAVVAIAKNNSQNVAKGCTENITITQDEIDRKVPRKASIYLEDYLPGFDGNSLLVETNFNYPLHLVRVANLLRDMSDSPSDPLDFIIERSLSDDDMLSAMLMGVVSDQLSAYVGAQSPSSQLTRSKIQQIYQALANVSDVKLYTTFDIKDETQDNQGQLAATHKFRYFSANVGGLTQKYFLKQGVNLFDGAKPIIDEAEALVDTQEADRVKIKSHRLSLPIAEAIFGTLLVDTFNQYDLEAAFTSMVDCSSISNLVKSFAQSQGLLASGIKSAMNVACRKVLSEMAVEIYDDIRKDITDSGLSTEIDLEGSANVATLSDGKTIGQMTNGTWIGIGNFTASRF